ncbi:MAG TPA: histidinol-phosphate transaminase [Candidatus Wujingus californicus]|uniref:histidinol-phosphate transaminase n=1 Tax=Candidatus Wujingus californicus TaxID=3367618 RepID=UPI002713C9D4|nr:histidinol-phosphate transaminase [Candidatus Brocadiales bacterium]
MKDTYKEKKSLINDSIVKDTRLSYFRDNIERMSGYTPGEQPKDGVYIKLNTNENPYPPSPNVLNAIKEAVNEKLRLYPDPVATEARKKVAAVLGTKPERVMAGNGSDDLLSIIIRSFAGPGDKVVFPYPSYMLYKTLAELQDGVTCDIDFNEDYSLPENFIVKRARVGFIANPNSPSGTMIPSREISKIASKINGVIVIDEAYADFAEDNCLSLVEKHDNLLILRTLSKSYSLAGIRLGFCIAQESLIQGMMKVKDSYNVDRLSIAAAVASLDDQKNMKAHVKKIIETRQYLTDSLRDMGFFVYPSQTNFVLTRCTKGVSANHLYQTLKSRKILVRYFNLRRLDDCLRITIGTKEEIDTLLKNLRELICK